MEACRTSQPAGSLERGRPAGRRLERLLPPVRAGGQKIEAFDPAREGDRDIEMAARDLVVQAAAEHQVALRHLVREDGEDRLGQADDPADAGEQSDVHQQRQKQTGPPRHRLLRVGQAHGGDRKKDGVVDAGNNLESRKGEQAGPCMGVGGSSSIGGRFPRIEAVGLSMKAKG